MSEKNQRPCLESSSLTSTHSRDEQLSAVWSSFADGGGGAPQQLSLVRALMYNDCFGFLCQMPQENNLLRWRMVVPPHDQAYANGQEETHSLSMLQASVEGVLEMAQEDSEADIDEISFSSRTDRAKADKAEARGNQKGTKQ